MSDDLDMVERFKRDASEKSDALMRDAVFYDGKSKEALNEAARIRAALDALSGRKATKARVTEKSPPRRYVLGGTLAVLRHAAKVETFTAPDVTGTSPKHVSTCAQRGLLDVVGDEPAGWSGWKRYVYRINDKGRAWLAAHGE